MHTDEFRDPEELKQLRIAKAISESKGIYTRLPKLEGKVYISQLTRLEIEKDELARSIGDAHRIIEELKHANSILNTEKDLANERLENLRSSRTMRVGKSVTSPAKFARKFAKSPKAASQETAKEINKQWKKLWSNLKTTRKVQNGLNIKTMQGSFPKNTALLVPSPKSGVPQLFAQNSKPYRTISPLDAFNKNPSTKNFERALNFLWFTMGELARTKDLVAANPMYVAQLAEVPKSLALRVLGESRLLNLDLVPDRSEFPAYVAEHGRVMYCVHQSPVYNSNGYSTRTRGVANGMKSAGENVVVVARPGYPWDSKADIAKPFPKRRESRLDGIQYVHIPGGNLNRDPIDHYVMQSADALVREARMFRPSVIQAASNFRTALPALIAARRLGIPFVYEVRGLWEFTEASTKPGFENTQRFEAMRDVETLVATNADRVLAITPQVKDELVARGVDPHSVVIAPNSVDPETFAPIPKDKNYARSKKISVEVPVIGFAGSIVGYEGLDILLEASSILQKRGIEHQVVIAGSGAAENELKESVSNLKLDNNVLFLGRLPQNQMTRLQSAFDIVVCPRKSNLVTEMVSPLKPLESFAAGRATVLSDVSPHRDLAGSNQERALLCNADDAESLADQLQTLIKDPELAADLERTARLWIVRERTWKKLGERMLKAHQDAVVHYQKESPASVPLSSLHVGVIGDEFTRSTLEHSFNVELLSRHSWREQINSAPQFDMIFVESAWEGNGGEWARGVGHYSDEESSDLRGILELARRKGIPTVFWNKEDPVHIARFEPNAVLFDHVFTTDANMIPRYLKSEGCRNKTASSLPFYAQPKLHNPLPGARKFRNSVAYAGSYYGDRYKERSQDLEKLLEASSKYAMDIYDRQANNPDSPYKFPEAYRHAVRGGLPYREVVDSYKAHIAHLNVNSVLNSPTMFSRRVVEIPACGGIVLSAYGRGITETIGSNIANSSDIQDYRAWLHDWMTNPIGRLNEIWRQMRTIYRSHTTESALAIVARTAGISVRGLEPIKYYARIADEENSLVNEHIRLIGAISEQSIRPEVLVIEEATEDEQEYAKSVGLKVTAEAPSPEEEYYEVTFSGEFSRTFAEDVLLPTRFGNFSEFYIRSALEYNLEDPVVSLRDDKNSENGYLAARRISEGDGQKVNVTLPYTLSSLEINPTAVDSHVELSGKTLLVAGHDLKFAGAILDKLQDMGCQILIDEWKGHNKHDSEISKDLLSKADVVLCEWGLGNAVWYSQNVSSGQTLIVRVHSQELFLPFLQEINKSAVDKFIFVGELVHRAALASHGVPGAKSVVIPNFVDTESLGKKKTAESDKTLGMVGIVPKSKRLDRALDILEALLEIDPEYKLRIKGKTPEDYPWMKHRPEELKYYSKQYERIDGLNAKFPGAVCFDGFGADMDEWYRNIGFVLSTSEFESFHLTIADGAASGAVPVLLNWPGADFIYPYAWLSGTTAEMVNAIVHEFVDGREAQKFVESHFSQSNLLQKTVDLIQNSLRNNRVR